MSPRSTWIVEQLSFWAPLANCGRLNLRTIHQACSLQVAGHSFWSFMEYPKVTFCSWDMKGTWFSKSKHSGSMDTRKISRTRTLEFYKVRKWIGSLYWVYWQMNRCLWILCSPHWQMLKCNKNHFLPPGNAKTMMRSQAVKKIRGQKVQWHIWAQNCHQRILTIRLGHHLG